ncbi:hypothetical protein [Cesiribacter andamanensis]|uniref:Uncharacterized protein n=1 Tax=Cesiribacter andamanensis AMV16 TaxID=1279009 RepID=M7NXY7_9BACT|nr:hypothetical protein [Cesiribacter andamanensis]EMR03229.1 hypothetical protein ADICEAN_01622 [Cesiribacter andamanensis AMV16]
MLTPLSRKDIFSQSPVADGMIAEVQGFYARGFDEAVPEELEVLNRLYDHRQVLQPGNKAPQAEAILTLRARTRSGYARRFPKALQGFLEQLGCRHLYLLDWLAFSWQEFPFETADKAATFSRLAQGRLEPGGFLLEIRQLSRLLPLFFFSGRFDGPVIYLIAAEGLPLSLQLCDDGNLHLAFHEQDRPALEAAASQAGLLLGGDEVCFVYYTQKLT